MTSAVSTRGRRIIGTLERGADLAASLCAACRAHGVTAGTIGGVGALGSVDLSFYEPDSGRWRPPRHVEGHLAILNLTGAVAVADGEPVIELWATLAREGATGIELFGGPVAAAAAWSVEYRIDCCDDLVPHEQARAERLAVTPIDTTYAADAALPRAAEPTTEPPSENAAAARSWADVIEASAEAALATEAKPAAQTRDRPEEEARAQPGDVIEHPRFKRCVVHRIEGDYEFLQVALKNGRVVRLSLDMLELSPLGVENGQRVFSVRIT